MFILFTKYIIIIMIYNYHPFNIIFKSCHILCITIFLNFKYKLILLIANKYDKRDIINMQYTYIIHI